MPDLALELGLDHRVDLPLRRRSGHFVDEFAMLALEDLQILVVLERAVLLGAHLTSGEGALAGAPVPALSGRPCSTAHLPRKTPVVSTPADLQALLSAFEDPALAAILELAALTGARRQEILALEWADVDLDGARLTVSEAVEESKRGIRVKETKSAAGARTIHLPQRAVAALRAHRKRQLELRVQLGAEWYCGDLVFPNYETGGVRRPRNVIKAVARARRRAGIAGGTLHGFRHGHATELLRAGVAPKVAQSRLGHSTVAVTMNIYSHVLPSMDRDAADQIERVFATSRPRKSRRNEPFADILLTKVLTVRFWFCRVAR